VLGADVAQTIARLRTTLLGGARTARNPSAVDVSFVAVSETVGTAGRLAQPTRALGLVAVVARVATSPNRTSWAAVVAAAIDIAFALIGETIEA
jgi:hypothetical protein